MLVAESVCVPKTVDKLSAVACSFNPGFETVWNTVLLIAIIPMYVLLIFGDDCLDPTALNRAVAWTVHDTKPPGLLRGVGQRAEAPLEGETPWTVWFDVVWRAGEPIDH